MLSIGLMAACSQASVAGAPVATNQVDLPRSYKFAPEDITVPAGTAVTWTNNDNFTHSVQLENSSEVQMMRPSESVTRQFTRAGLYPYICSLHPQDMKGSVLVVAAAGTAASDT
jgi:plastocyanin